MKIKSKKKQKIIEITVHDIIKYKPLHKCFGRAMFQICPVFKNGIIRELFIYRRQQDNHEIYKIDLKKINYKANTFHIESWTHETDSPRIWRESWCKDHKTIMHEVYVPNNTNQIKFNLHFGDTISILFEAKEKNEEKSFNRI